MKKRIIGVIAAVSLFATVGYANNFMISGLGFVAPSVIGKSNIYKPEVGEIVYDSSDATFYGYDSNNQWQALNGAGVGVPSGSISAFGGSTTPAGYLLCDGRPVSRITYAALFAVIGTNFGEGDGTNTFNLPDLRGRFLRGLDETDPTNIRDADRDLRIASNPGGNVGNNIGSLQDDAIRNITATFRDGMHYNAPGRSSSGAITLGGPNNALGGTTHSSALTVARDTAIFDASNVVPTGGDNRPKNVTVNYIIKI